VSDRTFRLERRHGRPFSPAFYGNCQPDSAGTRIEGYFALPPRAMIGLRVWLVLMVILTALGVVVNVLDLTIRTHFTVDPDVGLTLSIFFMLISIGFYVLERWLGSLRDSGSLAYLEQNVSASIAAND